MLSRPEGESGLYLCVICIIHEPRATVACRRTIYNISLICSHYIYENITPSSSHVRIEVPRSHLVWTPWTNLQGYHTSFTIFLLSTQLNPGMSPVWANAVFYSIYVCDEDTVFSRRSNVRSVAADFLVLSQCHREILVRPPLGFFFFLASYKIQYIRKNIIYNCP